MRLAQPALGLAIILLGTQVIPDQTAAASPYPDIVGDRSQYRAADGDTFIRIARRFNLGYVELLAANPGIDPWLPDGSAITLPTAHILPDAVREGIVVNLADQRLYFFPDTLGTVQSHPVSIGTDHGRTPIGETRVIGKRERPAWIPPPSIRAEKPYLPAVVPPGPTNPLGAFSLDLGFPSYRIHGTPFPNSIGRRATHGCVRLYPEGIAALFPVVAVGTKVTLVDQPAKLGWFGGELFLEIHPSQTQADELASNQPLSPEPIVGLRERIEQAAGPEIGRIDWAKVARTARQRRGIPERITR